MCSNLEVDSFHTDPRAVMETGFPALVVFRILNANNTLPAVELHSAAESLQVHIEFKWQKGEDHVCDLIVEGPGWINYRAMRRGGAVQRVRVPGLSMGLLSGGG